MAAIATDNGRLAIMELDVDWEPGLPLLPGAFTQADDQQLLWGFPDILWTTGGVVVTTFWCALTGMSGMTGGGDILELGG